MHRFLNEDIRRVSTHSVTTSKSSFITGKAVTHPGTAVPPSWQQLPYLTPKFLSLTPSSRLRFDQLSGDSIATECSRILSVSGARKTSVSRQDLDSSCINMTMESIGTREGSATRNLGQSDLSQFEAPIPNSSQDSGPVPLDWSQELLTRYNTDLTKLDEQEETLLERLAALQKLQSAWATAGRITEMERSTKRLKTRITKVSLEDERLSKKRAKLEEATIALQNVLGMLDDTDPSVESRAVA